MATIDPAVGHRFVLAIADRDWDTLASLFSSNAAFHAVILSTKPFREQQGPGPITGQIRAWFQDGDIHELLDSSVEPIVDRLHLRYRVRNREHGTWYVVEQHAFLSLGPNGIETCDLLCSGFRPIDPPPGTVAR
jgi:hypothetical protein